MLDPRRAGGCDASCAPGAGLWVFQNVSGKSVRGPFSGHFSAFVTSFVTWMSLSAKEIRKPTSRVQFSEGWIIVFNQQTFHISKASCVGICLLSKDARCLC